ncbi:hypothetical protein FGB62_44g01 [Gracilaria domingensis]|nr:hypothetical protein FGB62_44g01 [Gracilaria domingensis]
MPSNDLGRLSEKQRETLMRECEHRIKRFGCEQSMVNLATLIFLDPTKQGNYQQAIQLCERAIKQHNSCLGMYALAEHFYFEGTKKQKKRVIPLLESSIRLKPMEGSLYFLGKALFYGKFGETDQPRAINLLRRALTMDENYITMGSLAKMCLIYEHEDIKKKDALEMFAKVIEIGKDPYHMRQLAKLYEIGTPVLKPCERCRLKWTQMAEEYEQNSDSQQLSPSPNQ